MLDLSKLRKSFKFAFNGLKIAFKQEQNLGIHIFFAFVVIVLGLFFNIRKWEWVTLFLLIMLILILEMINTIFERFSDMLQPRVHIYVKIIKDMMAATVLIAAIGSVVIGLIIFLPYFEKFFK